MVRVEVDEHGEDERVITMMVRVRPRYAQRAW
jgi:hypothetical protein